MRDLKILYIDDTLDSSDLVNYLTDLGSKVTWAKTIQKAEVEILSKNYNLVLCEMNLISGNCLEFLKNIKQIKAFNVIVISQAPTQEELSKAIEIGVDLFLPKPLNFSKLSQKIQELSTPRNTQNKDTYELPYGYIFLINTNQLLDSKKNSIPLTLQETNLIKTLIKNRSLCSYEYLQTAISTTKNLSSVDTLRTVVKKIRQKTYDEIIITMTGFGYKIDNIQEEKKYNLPSLINISPLKKKILLLMKSVKNSNILKSKLFHYGFECEQAFSLSEAEHLTQNKFDYLITELHLSDVDAIELIRNKQGFKQCKFIILSDNNDTHYKEYLYFQGIVDYIESSSDLDYLAYNIYVSILKVEENTHDNNILLVEASKKISEQIRDILLPRNYVVDLVNSVENVLDLINYKQYNLIILDLELEGVNSIEFLFKLKKHVDQSLPIIMLSAAQRSYAVVKECYINGAVECLRKPIFAEEFVLKINQWIEFYRQNLTLKKQYELLSSYKEIVDETAIVSKTDPNGTITYVNKTFIEISGYQSKELIGKNHNIIRHPENKKIIFSQMWNTIKNEKRIWQGVIKNRKKDGSSYTVQSYIMPITNTQDEIVEYIALRKLVNVS